MPKKRRTNDPFSGCVLTITIPQHHSRRVPKSKRPRSSLTLIVNPTSNLCAFYTHPSHRNCVRLDDLLNALGELSRHTRP